MQLHLYYFCIPSVTKRLMFMFEEKKKRIREKKNQEHKQLNWNFHFGNLIKKRKMKIYKRICACLTSSFIQQMESITNALLNCTHPNRHFDKIFVLNKQTNPLNIWRIVGNKDHRNDSTSALFNISTVLFRTHHQCRHTHAHTKVYALSSDSVLRCID